MTEQVEKADLLVMAKAISRLLKKELQEHGRLKCRKGHIQLTLSRPALESSMGILLQMTQQAIDRAFPERQVDIPLTIRDEAGYYQLQLKIWHTHLLAP